MFNTNLFGPAVGELVHPPTGQFQLASHFFIFTCNNLVCILNWFSSEILMTFIGMDMIFLPTALYGHVLITSI